MVDTADREVNAEIDAFVERSKELTGKEVRERTPWNSEVTADAIRHFAFGISDDNPLWLDADYAARGPYGRLVAPPAFLTSVLPSQIVRASSFRDRPHVAMISVSTLHSSSVTVVPQKVGRLAAVSSAAFPAWVTVFLPA